MVSSPSKSVSRSAALLLLAFLCTMSGAPFTVRGASMEKSMDKPTLANAYSFAGVILDRSRRVERNKTTAEVKVVEEVMPAKHAGKSYDIVFLILPDAIERGEIVTLTSAPVANCRPHVTTFLTETLSPKRIAKAYKGAKLVTSDKNKTAAALSKSWAQNDWLRDCSAEPEGEFDVFKVLVVSQVDM